MSDVEVDLDGYLSRVGVQVQTPDLAGLQVLHEAHVRTFTFDNIDVLLEQHPGVEKPGSRIPGSA